VTGFREPSREDYQKTMVFVALVVSVGLLGAVASTLIGWPGVLVISVPIMVGMLAILVRWHARTFGYRCAKCGHEFTIGAWTDFFSPHYPSKKFLRCPSCGKRSWADVLTQLKGGGAGSPSR